MLLEEPRAELTALHFMPFLLRHGIIDQVHLLLPSHTPHNIKMCMQTV